MGTRTVPSLGERSIEPHEETAGFRSPAPLGNGIRCHPGVDHHRPVTMPARPSALTPDLESQRKLGSELFNYAWTLLEKQDRSERETDRMIDAAHASRLFWEEAGQPVNHARGEWQISRAYATAGRAGEALHHAHRCLEICQEHGIGDFDLAYAYESLARAHGLAGDGAAAARYRQQAIEAAGNVSDKEDRELLFADLNTLPG